MKQASKADQVPASPAPAASAKAGPKRPEGYVPASGSKSVGFFRCNEGDVFHGVLLGIKSHYTNEEIDGQVVRRRTYIGEFVSLCDAPGVKGSGDRAVELTIKPGDLVAVWMKAELLQGCRNQANKAIWFEVKGTRPHPSRPKQKIRIFDIVVSPETGIAEKGVFVAKSLPTATHEDRPASSSSASSSPSHEAGDETEMPF